MREKVSILNSNILKHILSAENLKQPSSGFLSYYRNSPNTTLLLYNHSIFWVPKSGPNKQPPLCSEIAQDLWICIEKRHRVGSLPSGIWNKEITIDRVQNSMRIILVQNKRATWGSSKQLLSKSKWNESKCDELRL